MPYPNAIEVCRSELFTNTDELRERYPQQIVDKILRVREMYNWFISMPSATDREFIAEVCSRHNIHRTTAYSDLNVVKTLLPILGAASREFMLWRTNSMLLETYEMAKKRKDTKTMERAATSYGKINHADAQDEQSLPLDQIVRQPFMATDDPRVLGIEPIPNIQAKIDAMIEKYRKETIDIDDVEFEDMDLELETLFPDSKPLTDNESTEGLL